MENQLCGQEGNTKSPKNSVMMEIVKRGQEQAKGGGGHNPGFPTKWET